MRMLNTIARRVSTSVPRPPFLYITEYGLIITDKFKTKSSSAHSVLEKPSHFGLDPLLSILSLVETS